MTRTEALNVLMTEHPEWQKIPRKRFDVTSRDGWDYVVYKDVEIERIRIVDRFILEEWLSRNPDDY